MGASETLLALDWDRTAALIAEFIRKEAAGRRRDGALLGISGGLDSAVAAALACEALGPRRVQGVILPERDTHPDSVGDARAVARHLNISTHHKDLAGVLRKLGLYGFVPRDQFLIALDLAVTVYTLGIALKIVSNTRLEIILREEEKQLIHARLSTLRGQVNPHFLFNTLNSISALIRTDAEMAREMTRMLSWWNDAGLSPEMLTGLTRISALESGIVGCLA